MAVTESKLEETLAAAVAIMARGDRLTYMAMSGELGVPRRTLAYRVERYRKARLWPYPVERIRSGPAPRQVTKFAEATLAALGAIRARGDVVTYVGLAAELRVTWATAFARVIRLRALGIPTGEILRSPRADQEAIGRLWNAPPELAAGIAARKARLDARKAREAIDGREEIDDPRHAVPPRSRWRPKAADHARERRAMLCQAWISEWKQLTGRA
jgi:hypothetical protein